MHMEIRIIMETRIQYGGPAGGMNQRFPGIQERNIAIAVILSIVTCGLYGIYWMIKLNDEVNQICGDTQASRWRTCISVHIDYMWNLWMVLDVQDG